jgi:endonuclease I
MFVDFSFSQLNGITYPDFDSQNQDPRRHIREREGEGAHGQLAAVCEFREEIPHVVDVWQIGHARSSCPTFGGSSTEWNSDSLWEAMRSEAFAHEQERQCRVLPPALRETLHDGQSTLL